MNINDLISKATDGDIEQQEIEEVVRCLETGSCSPYEVLLVIGRSGAHQYRGLVEKYLDAHDNPMLVRLALMILCRYWALSLEYKVRIQEFVRKIEWDDEGDVRLLAISIAGALLPRHHDRVFLQLLIHIFRDPSEDQLIRETAYCALGEAAGKNPSGLPIASRHFDLERDLDPDVVVYIEKAERQL
jgi:hypothetical protein